MARVGIVVGLLLCGLTFVALVGTSTKSPTLFIPMMFGIPVLFCGVVALNPHRRKHAMLVASAIGMLGTVVGAARATYLLLELAGGNESGSYDFKVVGAMSVICTVFVMICVVSFIQTRRRKAASIPVKPVSSISLADTVVGNDRVPDVKPRESA